MNTRRPRLAVLLAIALLASACSASPSEAPAGSASPPGAPSSSDPPASDAATRSGEPMTTPLAADDALLSMELRDVRTDATFTLAELAAGGPVIIETMAIWCSNCRQQMQEVTAAHEIAEFHSVSIDVDPTELAEDLVAYADREGFDWPFVLADAELASLLRDRFGTAVLQPPSMPKLLIRPDGSVELLPLGELLRADEIAALVEG